MMKILLSKEALAINPICTGKMYDKVVQDPSPTVRVSVSEKLVLLTKSPPPTTMLTKPDIQTLKPFSRLQNHTALPVDKHLPL